MLTGHIMGIYTYKLSLFCTVKNHHLDNGNQFRWPGKVIILAGVIITPTKPQHSHQKMPI